MKLAIILTSLTLAACGTPAPNCNTTIYGCNGGHDRGTSGPTSTGPSNPGPSSPGPSIGNERPDKPTKPDGKPSKGDKPSHGKGDGNHGHSGPPGKGNGGGKGSHK